MIGKKSRAWSCEEYKPADVEHAIHLKYPEIQSNSQVSKKSLPPESEEKEITLHKHKGLSSYEHPDKKQGSHSPVRLKLWGGE